MVFRAVYNKGGKAAIALWQVQNGPVQTAIDGFGAEFKDQPGFVLSVCGILEEYYNGIFLAEGLVDKDLWPKRFLQERLDA